MRARRSPDGTGWTQRRVLFSHSAGRPREGLRGTGYPAESDRCIPESVSGPDQRVHKRPALGGLLHPWPSDKRARDPRRAALGIPR